MFSWGFSDSLLIQLHPQFSYYNWPNIWEMLLLSSIICFMASHVKDDPSSRENLYNFTSFSALCFIVDIIFDILQQDPLQHPGIKGLERMITITIANTIKNATELGHLLGPMARGNFQLFKRFDWFCGLNSVNIIKSERKRAFQRFIVFLAMLWFILR